MEEERSAADRRFAAHVTGAAFHLSLSGPMAMTLLGLRAEELRDDPPGERSIEVADHRWVSHGRSGATTQALERRGLIETRYFGDTEMPVEMDGKVFLNQPLARVTDAGCLLVPLLELAGFSLAMPVPAAGE